MENIASSFSTHGNVPPEYVEQILNLPRNIYGRQNKHHHVQMRAISNLNVRMSNMEAKMALITKELGTKTPNYVPSAPSSPSAEVP